MSRADLERAARAMALAEDEDYMEDSARYDRLARAAIEAIRVPSEEMTVVADALSKWVDGEWRQPYCAEIYTAMIDAILEEG